MTDRGPLGGLLGGCAGGLVLGAAFSLSGSVSSGPTAAVLYAGQCGTAGASIGLLVALVTGAFRREVAFHHHIASSALERYVGFVAVVTAAGVVLGWWRLAPATRIYPGTDYARFGAQGTASAVYWAHAALARHVAGGIAGGTLGFMIGALFTIAIVRQRSAIAILFWLAWAGCAGFCIGGITDQLFAYIVGTMKPPPHDPLNTYIMALLGSGIPGLFTMAGASLWFWIGDRSPRNGFWKHMLVAVGTGATLFSLFALETTSRLMIFFSPSDGLYDGQIVVEFFEGKAIWPPGGSAPFPRDAALLLVGAPLALAIAAGATSVMSKLGTLSASDGATQITDSRALAPTDL